MVCFEDLLFRRRSVVNTIRDCANASWVDDKIYNEYFTYVVGHIKWEHVRLHGPQSTMISAMIKHESSARRIKSLSKNDLRISRQILDPYLWNLFRYHLPS